MAIYLLRGCVAAAAVALAATWSALCLADPGPDRSLREVTVFAAASTTDALTVLLALAAMIASELLIRRARCRAGVAA
jgi:ABC-type molybdate transport system substrate-binding protein